ncbi:hypothetical protein LguiA_015987 [Lonicera macranthoides]
MDQPKAALEMLKRWTEDFCKNPAHVRAKAVFKFVSMFAASHNCSNATGNQFKSFQSTTNLEPNGDVGLIGQIPPRTIGNLTDLHVLSLHSNKLFGQIPSNFSNLKSIRNIYLQDTSSPGIFQPVFSEACIAQLDNL